MIRNDVVASKTAAADPFMDERTLDREFTRSSPVRIDVIIPNIRRTGTSCIPEARRTIHRDVLEVKELINERPPYATWFHVD
jgi:hypothetical protein